MALNHEPCPHPDFEAYVAVVRVENTHSFMADVQVRCAACHVRFRFIGMDGKMGMSYQEPMISATALELHAPIEPDPHMTMMMADSPDAGWPGP